MFDVNMIVFSFLKNVIKVAKWITATYCFQYFFDTYDYSKK